MNNSFEILKSQLANIDVSHVIEITQDDLFGECEQLTLNELEHLVEKLKSKSEKMQDELRVAVTKLDEAFKIAKYALEMALSFVSEDDRDQARETADAEWVIHCMKNMETHARTAGFYMEPLYGLE